MARVTKFLKIALYLAAGCVMFPVLLVGLALDTIASVILKVCDTVLALTYPQDL